MTNLLYDPPSGWMYGFPKPYKPLPGEKLSDTLLRDGYPQYEIDNGGAKYCRFIGSSKDLSHLPDIDDPKVYQEQKEKKNNDKS